jgi:hypothetical protein
MRSQPAPVQVAGAIQSKRARGDPVVTEMAVLVDRDRAPRQSEAFGEPPPDSPIAPKLPRILELRRHTKWRRRVIHERDHRDLISNHEPPEYCGHRPGRVRRQHRHVAAQQQTQEPDHGRLARRSGPDDDVQPRVKHDVALHPVQHEPIDAKPHTGPGIVRRIRYRWQAL